MTIPNGEEGTRHTLKLMSKLAKAGKTALPVFKLARQLVLPCHQKDWVCEVKQIHQFVRDRIRYTKDVRGVETLQTPEKTLELKTGDCDDKSILAAALLESINHPTRFVAVGNKPPGQLNGQFIHVLVETKIGNKWIPVETTEPVELGWYPKNMNMRMRWHN